MSPIDLSIVIPAYMEGAIIIDSLGTLAAWLKSHNYGTVEVIVVVADSADGTASLAESVASQFTNFQVIKPGPRVGKGRDVRVGMLAARGRYRVFMDADLATPLTHLGDVAASMTRGDDCLIAVRDLWTIHPGLKRKIMSKFGNLLAQIILLPGIKDTQCGFKAFRDDVTQDVFSRQTMLSWSFDAELLAIARGRGYRIVTVDAPDWADPKAVDLGLVGDSPLGAALKTLRDLFIIRFNIWRGVYRRTPSSR